MKMKIALLCVTLITIYALPSRLARAFGSFDSAAVNAPARLNGSAESRSSNSQDKPYIWVNIGEEQDYPGYRRVVAGHEGPARNKIYVCRGWGNIPGKYYLNECYISWDGIETTDKKPPVDNRDTTIYVPDLKRKDGFDHSPQLLLTNIAEPSWVNISKLSTDRIEKAAVLGGTNIVLMDQKPLFICRAVNQGGFHTHSGKYHLPSKSCYIGYNGKEQSLTSDFQVLMMPPPTLQLPVIKSGLPKKP